MCSCSLRRGTVSVLQKNGITNFISEKELNAGATATLFKLIHCIGGNERITQALSGVKLPNGNPIVIGNQKDMSYLAAIYDDPAKNKQVFGGNDIKKILLEIQFTPEELKKSECTTGIATDN